MHKSSVRCTKSRVAMPKVPQILKTFSVHGWTLEGALNLAPQSPFLHVAELWSGVGNVVKKAGALGLLAKPFDKYRVPGVTDQPGLGCEDLLTHEGFRTASSSSRLAAPMSRSSSPRPTSAAFAPGVMVC